jgi:hypothetical protein
VGASVVGALVTGGGATGVVGGGATGVVGGGATGVVGGGAAGVVGGGATGVVGGGAAGLVAGGVVTDLEPGEVGVLSGAGVGVLPEGLTVGPGVAVCGLTRALSRGGSPPADFSGCRAIPLGLALPPAAFCGPPDSAAAAAGQLARLHAMNPSFGTLDVPPVPYQQMMTMAPRTPAPIIRFRTECGRRKSSSFCPCSSNDFPPLTIAIS